MCRVAAQDPRVSECELRNGSQTFFIAERLCFLKKLRSPKNQ